VNQIVHKEQLAEGVYLMRLAAPHIAQERQPGQFVILQLESNFGERIPLTIADADPEEGTITIIFQVVGKTTRLLAQRDAGEAVKHLVGPLGTPTHIERFGHVVCVGGGIGVAPLYPIAQGMKKAGNRVTVVMGARTAGLMILEAPMRALADELVLCTDDGSLGQKTLVTGPLKAVCEQTPPPDLVVAIGPPVMMRACAETTRPYGVHTMVSLNTIMVDGTGMCGGCRVTVGGETKFVCVDGPEFDGHLVDFENMIARSKTYRRHEDHHDEACRLETAIQEKEEKSR